MGAGTGAGQRTQAMDGSTATVVADGVAGAGQRMHDTSLALCRERKLSRLMSHTAVSGLARS